MRNLLASVLFMLVSGFAVSAPVFAHHGNASYDVGKTLSVTGVVTQWLWSNPHCLLKLDAKDDQGEVVHWVAEAGNPVDMLRAGWNANTIKPGDQITVDLTPSKNGVPVGRVRQLHLSDGTILKGFK